MYRFFTLIAVALVLMTTLILPAASAEAATPTGDCDWRWTSLDGSTQSAVNFYGSTKHQCLSGPQGVINPIGPQGICVWRWTSDDRSAQSARYMYYLTRNQCTGYSSYSG